MREATQMPMDFARNWYTYEDIHRAIRSRRVSIPLDVYSVEFSEWLCHQYRLAMAKGIQIGREQQSEVSDE